MGNQKAKHVQLGNEPSTYSHDWRNSTCRVSPIWCEILQSVEFRQSSKFPVLKYFLKLIPQHPVFITMFWNCAAEGEHFYNSRSWSTFFNDFPSISKTKSKTIRGGRGCRVSPLFLQLWKYPKCRVSPIVEFRQSWLYSFLSWTQILINPLDPFQSSVF